VLSALAHSGRGLAIDVLLSGGASISALVVVQWRPDPPKPRAGPVPLTDGLHQLLLYRKSVYWCSMGFLEVPRATRYQSAPSFLNRNDT